MKTGGIYISELSASRHVFHQVHFCRGNNSRRKTRVGLILRGSGTYLYLNRRLQVTAGDAVFIPEHVYCYSQWRGEPDIEVIYVSCFMHYERFRYEPQKISCEESTRRALLQICRLLWAEEPDELEAYARFYQVLKRILPCMTQSRLSGDRNLQTAVTYITDHWKEKFSVGELARACCVSESTLYHLFQKELGQTPIHFLNSIKINIAMEYLENSSCSVAEISRLVNFPSENHFRKVFTDITGMTPLKFRKKA